VPREPCQFGLPTPAESNSLLATKCAYALEKGLKVIFCIGEPLPIREQGADAVLTECTKQLEQIKGLLDPAYITHRAASTATCRARNLCARTRSHGIARGA
jgi:hypothetical protein